MVLKILFVVFFILGLVWLLPLILPNESKDLKIDIVCIDDSLPSKPIPYNISRQTFGGIENNVYKCIFNFEILNLEKEFKGCDVKFNYINGSVIPIFPFSEYKIKRFNEDDKIELKEDLPINSKGSHKGNFILTCDNSSAKLEKIVELKFETSEDYWSNRVELEKAKGEVHWTTYLIGIGAILSPIFVVLGEFIENRRKEKVEREKESIEKKLTEILDKLESKPLKKKQKPKSKK